MKTKCKAYTRGWFNNLDELTQEDWYQEYLKRNYLPYLHKDNKTQMDAFFKWILTQS